jgi:hypothetical protein
LVEWYWQGKTEVLGDKHYTVLVVDGWMSMEHWWNDTDRGNWSTGRETLYSVGGRWMNEYGALVEWYWQGKLKYWERNPSQCHFVQTQSPTWTGLESNTDLRGDRRTPNHLIMARTRPRRGWWPTAWNNSFLKTPHKPVLWNHICLWPGIKNPNHCTERSLIRRDRFPLKVVAQFPFSAIIINPQSESRQVRNLLQSRFTTQCDPVLPFSISTILSFP